MDEVKEVLDDVWVSGNGDGDGVEYSVSGCAASILLVVVSAVTTLWLILLAGALVMRMGGG